MARREPGLPSPGLWAPVFWMSKGLRIGKPCACGRRVPALPSGHVQASCSPLGLQELRPPPKPLLPPAFLCQHRPHGQSVDTDPSPLDEGRLGPNAHPSLRLPSISGQNDCMNEVKIPFLPKSQQAE